MTTARSDPNLLLLSFWDMANAFLLSVIEHAKIAATCGSCVECVVERRCVTIRKEATV